MKKLVLISLISLLVVGSEVSAEVIRDSRFYDMETLEGIEQEFYNNGAINEPVNPYIKEQKDEDHVTADDERPQIKAMPVFKKLRIKFQNYFKIKEHEDQLKQMKEMEEQYKAQQGLDSDEDDLDELTNRSLNKVYVDENGKEVKVSKFKNLFKRKKKKSKPAIEENKSEPEATIDNNALTGGVKEIVTQKEMILDCDTLNYNDETFEMEAIGNPVMTFPQQEVTIRADRLTYNTDSNIIKAYDNVEIIKDGTPICGDYVMINLNDESSIITNMSAEKMNMQINAKNVVASEDVLELTDGSMKGESHYILNLQSNMVGAMFDRMVVPEEEKSSISKGGLEIKVKAKEVFVTAKKMHDVVSVKDADIYYKDKHLFRLDSFSAHTNKNHEYFEANYPEFGNIPRMGMFIGPGFVFDVPTGGTMKFIPFLNYSHKFGIGAALKYRSGTNYTEAYYGSAENIFVLRGRQYFDDRLYAQYGVNSYLDDWWMGTNMAKYRAELVYRDAVVVPNTLGKNLHARYRHRFSAGYMQEADYNRHHENLGDSEMGTARLKYMAELSQDIFKYKNKAENFRANLKWLFQGSAAVYGTGDTQFIGRTGPVLYTQYKRWMQDVGYMLAGVSDDTPIPKIDTYRYGRSSVFLREGLRINKYLSASWFASAALSNDATNGDLFQENGFYVSLGPDDLKITLGYDFIRERTYFLFSTALDLKGTSVDYKKMVIKNPDKLAKDDSEKVKPVSFDKPTASKKEKLEYAKVIEIEDPDREQL